MPKEKLRPIKFKIVKPAELNAIDGVLDATQTAFIFKSVPMTPRILRAYDYDYATKKCVCLHSLSSLSNLNTSSLV